MWEFVDKVVYINLDHREDRRNIMNTFFKDGQIPTDKIERFSAIRHTLGIIGCAMGHIQILKKAKREGWKSVLILEDDLQWVKFEENYKKLEELVSTPNWDVCMLGGLYMETTPPKIHVAFCTNAYIVQSHYYDTLLENFETGLYKKLNKQKAIGPLGWNKKRQQKLYNKLVDTDNFHNIDVYWFKLQLKDNWIGVIEPMIEQIPSYSDIYQKMLDRTYYDYTGLYTFIDMFKEMNKTNNI